MKRVKRQSSVITAARVFLVPPEKSDVDDWLIVRANNRAHLEPWEPTWSPEEPSRQNWKRRLKNWKSHWQDGRGYAFLIREIETGALLGGATLSNVRFWPANTATLGYWLAAEAEGHGYMSEAVIALCDWTFRNLFITRIEAAILPDNKRSRGVLDRAGFQEEGYAKLYLEINGHRRDHILFAKVGPNH